MSTSVHPGAAPLKGEKPFPVIPCRDHYADSEKLMVRALEPQDSIRPVVDLCCDCEVGVQADRVFFGRRQVAPLCRPGDSEHAR